MDVTAHPDVSPEQLEAAVIAELDALHEKGVTSAEVARALALVETGFVTSLQSAAERADQLSRFTTYFGDPLLANKQVERYQAVTVEKVNAFTRERLGPDNRAVLWYLPAEETESDNASGDDLVAANAGLAVTGI